MTEAPPSLAIQSGELLVLLGRSGCGKSTLLRIIAGLEEASEGELFIGGRLANHLPPRDRDLAMVFQSYALYPHMTVEDNIAFPLTVRGVARAERRKQAAEVAGMLGLGDLLKRRPHALSGGQRQRVAIGRALVRSPDLFLFDEPLSNLDAALRTRMRLELKELHERLGATMVYVTHDQIEAMTLATRIAILDKGVVQQIGTPESIYRSPRNTFVASFIGSPPMNLIAGRLEGPSFRAGDLEIPLTAPRRAAEARGAVTLGLRPEHIRVCREAAPGRLAARVVLSEPVGDRGYVHLEAYGHELRAQVGGAEAFAIRAGDTVCLEVDGDACHLFDTETGTRFEADPAAS
ncbi:MAG: ABC transporter ATP-binding protein [Planctomycetota bacterium]